MNVIVTELEYKKGFSVFQNAEGVRCMPAPSDEAGLAARIRETGATFAIIGVNKYTRELYDAIPAGGVIARFGVGHDGVDKTLAKSKGILCCNTPGVLDDSVAECAVGLMLASARHIAASSAASRAGVWNPRLGAELARKTLAVIGCGHIGRKVAKIAKYGLGMKTVGFDVAAPKDTSGIDEFTFDFNHAVKNADVVSLHIPGIPATRDFINQDRLKVMKRTAILVNTARGSILDEDALFDALQSGVIAGAALDVFKTEPFAPQDPEKDLRTLDGIVMTPHIGSSTVDACERMARAALRNIELAAQGKINEMDLLTE